MSAPEPNDTMGNPESEDSRRGVWIEEEEDLAELEEPSPRPSAPRDDVWVRLPGYRESSGS